MMSTIAIPQTEAPTRAPAADQPLVLSLRSIRSTDIGRVGGKAANLGEMIAAGLPVPPGFCITVEAYHRFIRENDLSDRLTALLAGVHPDDTKSLEEASTALKALIAAGRVPDELRQATIAAYDQQRCTDALDPLVAVRSSATAEDTAEYSFAGMFESFLGVHGADSLLDRVKTCWASTFQPRAIFYRIKRGFPADMPLGVIVQRMVNSNKSGVMFTIDPATRNRSHMVIEAAWGLGETIVQGQVTPDRYVIDRATLDAVEVEIAAKELLLTYDAPTGTVVQGDLARDPRAQARVLSTDELRTLAALALRAESHYRAPQDLEFAIEGTSIYLTQTRPITTLTGAPAQAPIKAATPIVHGLGASPGTATGPVRLLAAPSEEGKMQPGDVLVTRMTSPDWVPIMRRAAAIVTESGGMTSHAAIVSRELGLPCIVGAHGAMQSLFTGTVVTVDGAAGTVTPGVAVPEKPVAASAPAQSSLASPAPITGTRLYVNLGEPDLASAIAARDVDGVGLLRAEFMMLAALGGMHPRALLAAGRADEFVNRMVEGIERIARAFHPRPVIYRAMDFRSNEFHGLTGADQFEQHEENPMIGYRGCYRYTREADLFGLELRVLALVRAQFDNVHLMIPFVRREWELAECLRIVNASALGADRHLERWIMAEVPSVVWQLARYAKLGITAVSIGSNDLTQLMLGTDRDNERLAPLFDERDDAVRAAIRTIIAESHANGLRCSICGQAPSVYPEYAEFLVDCGIDSISVNPDAIERTRRNIAMAERRLLLSQAVTKPSPALPRP